MFKIIVTLYLLMNGQPFGEPVKFNNKISFDTVEQCMIVKDSERNQAAVDRLRSQLDEQKPENGSYTLAVSCEKVDDGSL